MGRELLCIRLCKRTDQKGLTMTTRDPENSVHDEQFNAEEKASESTEEEITEMTTQEQPAGKSGS